MKLHACSIVVVIVAAHVSCVAALLCPQMDYTYTLTTNAEFACDSFELTNEPLSRHTHYLVPVNTSTLIEVSGFGIVTTPSAVALPYIAQLYNDADYSLLHKSVCKQFDAVQSNGSRAQRVEDDDTAQVVVTCMLDDPLVLQPGVYYIDVFVASSVANSTWFDNSSYYGYFYSSLETSPALLPQPLLKMRGGVDPFFLVLSGFDHRTPALAYPPARWYPNPPAAPGTIVVAPSTQQCVVSDWSSWSTCTQSCMGGIQYRTRTIIHEGNGVCPLLIDRQACNTQRCPPWCVMGDWSAWSVCTATCDGGTQTRTRPIIQQPSNETCPSSIQTSPCNTQKCNRDCEVVWSAWSVCNAHCLMTSTASIVQPQVGSGAPCPPTIHTRSCSGGLCHPLR